MPAGSYLFIAMGVLAKADTQLITCTTTAGTHTDTNTVLGVLSFRRLRACFSRMPARCRMAAHRMHAKKQWEQLLNAISIK